MNYQPKTGQPCHCRKGVERDNCPECEGTGQRIDFRAIRAKAFTPDTSKQLTIALEALKQFKQCDFTEENCANLEIASQRVRNVAQVALAKIARLGVPNE